LYPEFLQKDLVGLLLLGDKLSGELYYEEEIKLFVTLANDVAMAVKNAELIKDLKTAFDREHNLFIQTSIALATAIDARDKYTHGHSERVSEFSQLIVKELALMGKVESSPEFMETVQLSALLHDIGKIGIRDQILNKPAPLTADEFEVMKTHVTIGANIIRPVQGLEHLIDGILYHHERFDGNGYASGLKGLNIPLLGRIVNVADSYDTITTTRSYKESVLPIDALAELKKCAGRQFDPEIVQAFENAFNKGLIERKEIIHFSDMSNNYTQAA